MVTLSAWRYASSVLSMKRPTVHQWIPQMAPMSSPTAPSAMSTVRRLTPDLLAGASTCFTFSPLTTVSIRIPIIPVGKNISSGKSVSTDIFSAFEIHHTQEFDGTRYKASTRE
jgi:hypothetical protein